ncbi:MAG: hypothetical protein JNL25_14950 [Rhodospirillaceae bacterium]|nr:hypothetical protein [Rhodospirillaceae bacterium]
MNGRRGVIRTAWNRSARVLVILAAFGLGAPATSHADPSAWAPAWGYHGKHKHKRHKHDHLDHVYGHDHGDLGDRSCHGIVVGGAIGAATGGVIGAAVSDSDAVSILGGAILGAVVGGVVGHAIDQADADCAGRAIALGRRGEVVKWRNHARSVDYALVPIAEYRNDDRHCRQFVIEVTEGTQHHRQERRACLNRDGTWQIVG